MRLATTPALILATFLLLSAVFGLASSRFGTGAAQLIPLDHINKAGETEATTESDDCGIECGSIDDTSYSVADQGDDGGDTGGRGNVGSTIALACSQRFSACRKSCQLKHPDNATELQECQMQCAEQYTNCERDLQNACLEGWGSSSDVLQSACFTILDSCRDDALSEYQRCVSGPKPKKTLLERIFPSPPAGATCEDMYRVLRELCTQGFASCIAVMRQECKGTTP